MAAMLGRWVPTIILVHAALSGAVAAQESSALEEAKSQIESMQLDRAADTLDAALSAGTYEPGALAEVYRLRGEVAVGRGELEAAEEAFRRLLALEPGFALGEMVSPKIRGAFDAAKESLGGRSLELSHERLSGDRTGVALVIGDDPDEMVAAAEVAHDGAPEPVRVSRDPEANRVEVAVPAGSRGVILRALDEHGNRLRIFEVGDFVEVADTGGAGEREPEPEPEATGKPIYQRWWPWAGAVGLFAASGVVFGMAAQDAEDDLDALVAESGDHFFSEAKSIEDRGERNALLANLSFGAAFVTAAVGGYFIWRGFGAEEESRVEVTPAAGPEGAGINVEVSF